MIVIDQFVTEHTQELKELLVALAPIPAPSLCEEQRAAFCKEWLSARGISKAYIDDANNVVCPFGDISKEVVIIAAHSDVVFPDKTPLPLDEADGRLFCPGVGDDTANVAVLMMTAVFLCDHGITPKRGGVLLVTNAAEEGLGNLKGSKRLADTFAERVKAFISFDCHADELINGAVGSLRYRISADTVGGHSYFDFGRDNAIVVLSKLIDRLYALPIPADTHTTYNVGTISGGTSVNTIAQHAEMLFEIRSDDRLALHAMQQELTAIVEDRQTDGVSLTTELIGERPCADAVDPDAMQRLCDRAALAIEKHFGKPPVIKDGSTDCNTFLSRGIPSVCFGCVLGDGMHTREEYIELDSLPKGLKVAIETVMTYCDVEH